MTDSFDDDVVPEPEQPTPDSPQSVRRIDPPITADEPAPITADTPQPITRPVRAPLSDRAAEAHVLSCLMLRPEASTLPAEAFYYPEHRLLYLSIQRLHAAGKPVELATIAADLSDRGQFTRAGEWPFLFEIEARDKIPTALHLAHFADRVLGLYEKRVAEQHAKEVLRAIKDGEAIPAPPTLPGRSDLLHPTHASRPILSLTVPPANDPGTILGNRYLSRGDGAVLSSSSGMGKSAMAIQMAIRWSLNADTFGIKPGRALRVLYIQSEDSDGDVAEVTASIQHVLHLTPEQVAQVNANVLIVTDRTSRGTAFLHQLKLHIAAHKPDLVILNPLQAFIDGDITDSQDLGAFLREGLNALNHPAAFAYLLIHHTTKPATGKDRGERLWHEVMYDMAGGAELINWARAILSLRAAPTEGDFNLVLAKRGRRAGVVRQVEQGAGTRQEPITVIPLRHSTEHLPNRQPCIYWETREPDAPPDAEAPSTSGGRPAKFSFLDYANVFPTKASPGLPINELHRLLEANKAISKPTLHHALKRWEDEGDVEILRPQGYPMRYRKAL